MSKKVKEVKEVATEPVDPMVYLEQKVDGLLKSLETLTNRVNRLIEALSKSKNISGI